MAPKCSNLLKGLMTCVLATVICGSLGLGNCFAWRRHYSEDAVVMERSQLIVVGRLRKESIRVVPGHGVEAVLIVEQVLKGAAAEIELLITIHNQLVPAVDGRFLYGSLNRPFHHVPLDYVPIFDTSWGVSLVIENTLTDNLWFLRRLKGRRGDEPGTGNYGIAEPQDIRPLKYKDYYLAYLSKNPEAAIEKQIAAGAEVPSGAWSYLEHCDVQRVLAIPDPQRRVRALLPYFLKEQYYDDRFEAEDGLVAAGDAAWPYLLRLFQDPDPTQNGKRRNTIMRMWARMQHPKAGDVLLPILREHCLFWDSETIDKEWPSYRKDLPESARDRIYYETPTLVWVLGELGDQRAFPLILRLRERWKSFRPYAPGPNDPLRRAKEDLIGRCNRALVRLTARNWNLFAPMIPVL